MPQIEKKGNDSWKGRQEWLLNQADVFRALPQAVDT